MIKGLGTDIIEVLRIKGVIERQGKRFLDRVFTLTEQNYCLQYVEPERHFAGRFAAKEAIVKALGCGLKNGLSWLDFEIINDEFGKPIVRLSSIVQERFDNPALLVSISHCKAYATATALHTYFCVSSRHN